MKLPVPLMMGRTSEYGQENVLIEGFKTDYILTDKGYDSNEFILNIQESGADPVIPPQRNRLVQRDYDKILYKDRNRVERLFQKLKGSRRIVTRHERLKRNDQAMLDLAASILWLN